MNSSYALLLPDEPEPIRLMNTIWADRSGVHDALCSPADLHNWLRAVDLLDADPPEPEMGDVDGFRALRDALRRLAALVTDDTRPAAASPTSDIDAAVAEVNRAATRTSTWPQIQYRDGRLHRHTASASTPAARALSTMAASGIDLLAGEQRPELRACYAPGCVLYFTKTHPRREWCSTACGNRARAARHYQRHHQQ